MGAISSRREFLGLLPLAATAVVVPAAAIAEQPISNTPMVFEVRGDNMSPTLREGVHSVIAKPVARFEGRGIYVIEDADGLTTIYRVSRSDRDGSLYAVSDNRLYTDHRLDERWFNRRVVAKATAAVRHFNRAGGMI